MDQCCITFHDNIITYFLLQTQKKKVQTQEIEELKLKQDVPSAESLISRKITKTVPTTMHYVIF